MIAYFNGRFLPLSEIHISPEDRGFLFGDSLYEVIRYYPPGNLFQAEAHFQRLESGATFLRFCRTGFADLGPVIRDLIRQNRLWDQDAMGYIQVTRGCAVRDHAFPVPAPELTVFVSVSPVDARARQTQREQGIAVITVPDIRWARCNMKVTGLAANVLANQRAREAGAQEAIFVRDGILLEGSHSNFMAVMDGCLVTAPLSNYILPGVTRACVLSLARKIGIPVRESPICDTDIPGVSELMVTGTISEVTPVIRLDGCTVGDGTPGPLARKLQAELSAITLPD